jgi:hypothetical protein
MSAVRTGMARPPDDLDAQPGLWESFGTAVRLIVGWFCVAIGLLNLVVEADRRPGTPDRTYLLYHAMLLVSGALVLALGSIRPRPGVSGYAAFGAILVLGTAITAIPATVTVCCLSGFGERHGFPFTLVGHNAGGRWHLDSPHLLADLMFWGGAGLIVLVLMVVLRDPVGSPDETVGGVP